MEIFRKKNEATIICFPMVTTASPDTFDTGETVTDTAYYSDAEGAFTSLAITDTVSEIGTTGMYEISLTAAEMNHDLIIIKFTSTNAADTAVIIRTRAVDLDDLVRATTPANTLDVTAAGLVDVGLINGNATAAAQLALGAQEIISGSCEATPSTTVIQTDLAETQDDIYIGRTVLFTSGNAEDEATTITDYTGSTGTLTVEALANAPAASDTFIIL
jgi:hypothetical protein